VSTSRRPGVFVGAVFAAESAFFAVSSARASAGARHTLTTTEVGVLVAAYPAAFPRRHPIDGLVEPARREDGDAGGIGILIASTLGFGWGTNPLVLDTRDSSRVSAELWPGQAPCLADQHHVELASRISERRGRGRCSYRMWSDLDRRICEPVGRARVQRVAIVLALLLLAGPASAPAGGAGRAR